MIRASMIIQSDSLEGILYCRRWEASQCFTSEVVTTAPKLGLAEAEDLLPPAACSRKIAPR